MPITPGEVHHLELLREVPHRLGHTGSRTYLFEAGSAGAVTITAESFETNAYLSVEDEAGALLAEDDDGGIEQNARLVLEAAEGARYRIVASSGKYRRGPVAVAVRSGNVPPPGGDHAERIRAEFYRVYAGRYLERVAEDPAGRDAAQATAIRNAVDYYTAAAKIEHDLRRLGYAELSAREALRWAGEVSDAERSRLAAAFLGSVLAKRGRSREAARVLEPLLATFPAGDASALRTLVLDALGRAHLGLSDHAAARTCFEAMLATAEAQGSTANRALALRRLGLLASELGRADEALVMSDAELACVVAAGDAEGESLAAQHRGDLVLASGDLRAAGEWYARALERTTVAGRRCEIQLRLGRVHHETGGYGAAASAYRAALSTTRDLGLAGEEVAARLGLARVHLRTGRLAAARAGLEGLLADRELPPRARAQVGNNLANTLREIGDDAAARAAYEEALELFRSDGDVRGEATTLLNLGILDRDEGALERSVGLLERAAGLAREHGLAQVVTACDVVVADVLRRSGAADYADRVATRALLGAEAQGLTERALMARQVLARLALERDDGTRAAALLAEAEAVLERPRSHELDRDATAFVRAGFAAWSEIAQDLAAREAAQASDEDARRAIVAEGFEANGRWKGRSLLEGIAEHRSGARSPESIARQRAVRGLAADLSAVESELALAQRDQAPAATIEALRDERDELLGRFSAAREDLRRHDPDEADLDFPRGVSPARLQREVLGPGDVLVDYVAGERRLYAYVVSSDRVDLLDLGERAAVEADVALLLGRLRDPGRLGTPAEVAAPAQRLYAALLGPALAATGRDGRAERLIVVPSPSLAGLPFEALVVPGPVTASAPRSFDDLRFVLDRVEVSYAPSSSVLAALRALPPRSSAGRVLILADPEYGPLPGHASAVRMPRLPGARQEALAIAELLFPGELPAAASDLDFRAGSVSHASAELELHLGGAASGARLAGDLRSFGVLHFAAHGVVDPREPRNSGLLLAPREGDAGFVSVADVLELTLDADVTVLSACDTGRGRVRKGDGVQSLARGFLYAGSRSVVASLWQVSDEATMRTMLAFYERLRDGERSPRALTSAKRLLRAGGAVARPAGTERGVAPQRRPPAAATTGHPYYWAPFIVIGAP